MIVPAYHWSGIGGFRNRSAELARLDAWWQSDDREPVAVLGRRRVGKSWLVRRFAHGKAAVVLVADQLPPAAQLARFSAGLEPIAGVRPQIPDVAALFRVLHQLSRDEKLLVVIDEFPWLLNPTAEGGFRDLTAIQAAIEEERYASQLKLVLCGSHVAPMEALFGERNPMHGRLLRMAVRPLPFAEASMFLQAEDAIEAFERYAVAGGMPMYLSRLAAGPLPEAVCRAVLDRDAPLWNEGRAIVEQELREPRTYFAILERLAGGPKTLNEIAQPLAMTTAGVGKYLSNLADLRFASRREPFGAAPGGRAGRWVLDDPFLRFWFRFVFPFQADLDAGAPARAVYDAEVAPFVADHVAKVFESWVVDWLRVNRSDLATSWGPWWGNAANEFRRSNERTTEEIDAVGTRRGRVTVVAEAKWTSQPIGPNLLDEIDRYKLPALRQSGLKVAETPKVILFARSGYTTALRDLAAADARLELVDVPRQLRRD